jgi:hypothetical protein
MVAGESWPARGGAGPASLSAQVVEQRPERRSGGVDVGADEDLATLLFGRQVQAVVDRGCDPARIAKSEAIRIATAAAHPRSSVAAAAAASPSFDRTLSSCPGLRDPSRQLEALNLSPLRDCH